MASVMMMKAVTGEMINDKNKKKKDSAKTRQFYPSGHSRRKFWIHGFVFFTRVKLRIPMEIDLTKTGNDFAKPGN